MIEDRIYDLLDVRWLAEDIAAGQPEASFWRYVDTDRQSPLRDDNSWNAERTDGCLAMASTHERCSKHLSITGSPFCDFHEAKALRWMLALLDHRALRKHRWELEQAHEAAMLAVPQKVDSYVYFYELEGYDLVKIGQSRRPKIRTSQFRSGSGCIFPGDVDPKSGRLLGYISGDQTVERYLHHKFADSRTVGEWFKMTPPVRLFIEHALSGEGQTPCASQPK